MEAGEPSRRHRGWGKGKTTGPGMLRGCPGLPSRHAGANHGQAQGTGPAWCTDNIPATHLPHVPSVRVLPSASILPQVCKSDPTLSNILDA